jgi:hypothetical protein
MPPRSDFFSAVTRHTCDASKVELGFTCHSPFKPIAVQLPQKRVIESRVSWWVWYLPSNHLRGIQSASQKHCYDVTKENTNRWQRPRQRLAVREKKLQIIIIWLFV